MTLLVAGIKDETVWMVADTAITTLNKDVRERVNSPKIEVVSDNAIAGFAGVVDEGHRIIRKLGPRAEIT